MNVNKKIEVNASSLVELKAELIRKKKEFDEQTHLNEQKTLSRPKKIEKKPNIWSVKNTGVQQRALKDLEDRKEETDKLSASRKALEAKAKIYEQLSGTSTNIPESIDVTGYLVDFDEKKYNPKLSRRQEEFEAENERRIYEEEQRRIEREDIEDERRQMSRPIPSPRDSSEEWVDFTDSLGRLRRCLRRDLPKMINMSNSLIQNESKSHKSYDDDDDDHDDLPQDDDIISLPVKKGPIHYEDLRQNEIRTHGIGYFKFSKDEEKRQEEMEKLNELRKTTETKKAINERIKAMKLKQQEERLAKVRRRKWIREGKTEEEMALLEIKLLAEKEAERIDKEEREHVEPIIREEEWRKYAPKREWDRGKSIVGDVRKGKSDAHQERLQEFAPPSCYEEKRIKKFKKYYPRKDEVQEDFSEVPPPPSPKIDPTIATNSAFDFIDEELTKIRQEPSNL
ncbi:DgyrCDS11390 [Dimorphilus gyrociliatus]|uniref:DgyrCDS11390 n=1 Tax=Dimorphilus gyrociliatus TaxID=2664684 RepID=A0A7I8W354_9ANNE|nr:DgyrCDS11390 [Dimorphilus gyrociliatus]